MAATGILALALGVLGGCGGDDDGDEGGTDATSSTAAGVTTTTAPPVASLSESLDTFVTDWNAANVAAVQELGTSGIALNTGAFSVAPGPNGTEAFAASVSDSVVLGGLRDPASGRITAVVVGVDPDGDTAATAVLATVNLLRGSEPFASFGAPYRDMATAMTLGATSYVPAGANDFVLAVVGGATEGDNLVMITAAPATDEATATAAAEPIRQAVLEAFLAGG